MGKHTDEIARVASSPRSFELDDLSTQEYAEWAPLNLCRKNMPLEHQRRDDVYRLVEITDRNRSAL